MLNFSQLERHYQLLQIIDQYQRLLIQYDTGLSASRLDGMPHNRNCHIDRTGEMLIKKENAEKKLQKLQALATAEAPQVEETIKAAAGRGKNAIKAELIFRARYQHGRDWPEIVDLFQGTSVKLIKALVTQRLEKMEE